MWGEIHPSFAEKDYKIADPQTQRYIYYAQIWLDEGIGHNEAKEWVRAGFDAFQLNEVKEWKETFL